MSSVSVLLKKIERMRGELLSRKKLTAALREPIGDARNKGKLRETKKRHASKGRGRSFSAKSEEMDVDNFILHLELLGLVKPDGRKMSVRKPFTLMGRASMSPRGMIFVGIQGAQSEARDIFVPPARSGGALPGDHVEVRLLDRSRDRFEGEIVRVARRSRSEYRMRLLSTLKDDVLPGIILDTPGNITASILPESIPKNMRNRLKPDDVVIVRLLGSEMRYMGGFYQEAEYIRSPLDIADVDADFERIAVKHGLRTDYPRAAAAEIKLTEPNENTVSDWSSRKDLRHLPTITIDGATSKDFDDAISFVPGRLGTMKLYVHIADVGYYVKPGSHLDEEARERAVSVYLADRVVPMLPEALSENLCSLVANRNRLAFTAEMTIKERNGRIIKSEFYKSVIRVDRRLTYDLAEEEIEMDDGKKRASKSMLGLLWDLAVKQRATRIKDGRVDLSIPEPKLLFGPGNSLTGVEYRERLRSSILIEECMLSANISTAAFLKKKKAPTLFRIHEAMEDKKLERLNSFLELYNLNYQMKDVSYRSIRRALEKVAETGDEVTERIFNILLLRSFMQAKYSGAPHGHWGLGFSDYCHFTSPIRRYPDLVVHRSLDRILKKRKHVYEPADIEELAFWTSTQERRAADAERDMVRLKMVRFIEKSGKTKFRGSITGFKSDRVFLSLENLPAEAVVSMRHLTNDSELIMPNDFSVYIKKLSRPAFLGEKWDLDLEEIETETMTIFCKPRWETAESPFGNTRGSTRRKRPQPRDDRSERKGERKNSGGDDLRQTTQRKKSSGNKKKQIGQKKDVDGNRQEKPSAQKDADGNRPARKRRRRKKPGGNRPEGQTRSINSED